LQGPKATQAYQKEATSQQAPNNCWEEKEGPRENSKEG
jgi:hypothetical protein